MKRIIAVLALGVLLTACQDKVGGGSGASHTFKNADDSVSYAIGMNIGKGMKNDSINIDPDILADGIRDAFGGKPQFKDSIAQNVLMAFQTKLMQKQQEKMRRQQDSMNKAGEGNKKKATAFLEENKKKPNVKTTASGLQYEVLGEGTGPMPKADDNVKVAYKGTLIDGTVFDSSEKNGPATFNVSGVIPGWTEALKMMKVGSKWRLWIPPDIGYGMNPPPGGKIGAGDLLIFEVELIEIVKKDAAPAAPAAPAPAQGK